MNEEKLLFETHDIIEAQLIKGNLEAAGIYVLLKGESLGGAYRVTADGLGTIRIYVMEQRFSEAKSIIQEKE
ncbi:MAG: DUF2007 domain-containing protein [Candidatus Firestonebacteria bacterium]